MLVGAWASAWWSQQGNKLIGSPWTNLRTQGWSVALSADGNTLVSGAPSPSTGGAWVFTRSSGAWTQQGSGLIGAGAVGSYADQGTAVAISSDGNTVLVGGPGDNGGSYSDPDGKGAAWVFTRSGGVWSQQGSKLVGTGMSGNAAFGRSVALSSDGNTAAIGGPYDYGSRGAVWVFTRSGGVWTQQGSKLVGSGGSWAAQGLEVALSSTGNTLAVGGSLDSSSKGATWVFTRSGGVWTQQGGKLVGSGAVGDAQQGSAVALSSDGNTLIAGGRADNCCALGARIGALWVFTRSGGVWTQQGPKLVSDGGYFMGDEVATTSNGNTFITNIYDTVPSAVTFTRSSGVWTQQQILYGAGNIGSVGLGGCSVAMSSDGSTASVGNWADNSQVGAAWVFVNAPCTGPTITTQPQSQTIASGQTATLTVSASGTAPLAFQWYQGPSGDTSHPVGTNSSSYTTPALTTTTSYWVRVSNACGQISSQTATITVCTPPSITSQPRSQTIVSGRSATLTVAASGTPPLSYQWYRGTRGVGVQTPVGTNSPSYTSPALTSTTSYWVRVSSACGQWDSATATITVVPPVAITTPPTLPSGMFGVAYSHQFEATGGIPGGASPSPLQRSGSALRLVAAAAGGGYTWRGKRGSPPGGVILSAQGLLAGTPTESGDFSFTVEAEDSVGNTAEQDFSMTVDPCDSASIAAQPQAQIVRSGQSATLTVGAGGTAPLSYQWYQGSSGDTSQPVGNNAASFTTPALSTTTGFWVRVSSPCGHADSATTLVRVSDASVRRLGRRLPQATP